MINMIHIISRSNNSCFIWEGGWSLWWRDGWGCSEKCCAATLHRHPPLPFTPLPADADSWCEVSEKEGLRVSYMGRGERIGRLLTQKTSKNWCSLNIFLLNNNELLNGLVVTGCPILVVRSVHLIYSNWSGKDDGASCVYYGFLLFTIVYRITLFAPRKYSGIWLPPEINGD